LKGIDADLRVEDGSAGARFNCNAPAWREQEHQNGALTRRSLLRSTTTP